MTDRLQFRHRLLVSVIGFLGACIADAADRPNILVILTDDHGWADLGAQGVDTHIRTPNLDRLAGDGVRFTRGYVTAPQCTPSRAGLLTGQYQNRFGVEHNGIPMRREVVTLPERLKQAGYVTGISGKWHLEHEDQRGGGGQKNVVRPELGPWGQGFDEYFSGFMQDYEASHGLDGTPYPDAPKKVREAGCRIDLQTEWALQFLKRRAAQPHNRETGAGNTAQPFFLYLSYMAPHTPLEWPEPYISQVPQGLPKERRSALALLAAIDRGVGRVREQLRAMGEEQNTLLFFLGDNGAPLAPHATRPGQRNPWDGSINLPMRGQKGMLSEGGIRVPFAAAWPGTLPAGQVFDHPVISLDIAATGLAAAGLPVPPEIDGVNLLPYLTSKKAGPPHETLYWRWMSQAAVQEFPWKLIALGGQGNLLFDITNPEGEAAERNLIQQQPEIAARLLARLEAWTAALQPPGMPPALADHHVRLFADHAISAAPPEPAAHQPVEPEGSIQGWLCRNGSLAVTGGALVITPAPDLAKNARPFLARTGLDLAGPVTVTLRARAATGGQAAASWRTTEQPDFTAAQSVAFDWPAGAEWQDVTFELPVQGRLIHLRITPAKAATGIGIQSIELRGKAGQPQAWRFGEPRP